MYPIRCGRCGCMGHHEKYTLRCGYVCDACYEQLDLPDVNWNDRDDLVKITSLKPGARFECISGWVWEYVRPGGKGFLTFARSVDRPVEGGEEDGFANCALVKPLAERKERDDGFGQGEGCGGGGGDGPGHAEGPDATP